MASDQEQRKAMKQIYNEIVQINKKSVYDDEAFIAIPDTDNPRVLEVTLAPRSGYYQGGEFKFKIVLPEQYPNKPPTVSAVTKMYHPNISYSGNVCLNILSGEFDPNYRLEHYINALLWLLLNPNFDSQLNGSLKRDTYALDVVLAMRGFPVGGTTFERTLAKEQNDNWVPSEDLMKVIFHSLWGGISQKNSKITIPEFLKDPATQEWIKFEPGLERMISLNIDGVFVLKGHLSLVPQNAILKNSIWMVASKPVLVLTGSYNNGKPTKELIAKFLEAKEEDLVEAPGNVQALCGMPEDKVSIFSCWNKFEHTLINDNVFLYETVVVPSWSPNVLFQVKSSIFKNFPSTKVGKFSTETAGAVVASTSTVDAWYQTIQRTISVQDFLKEPNVRDWVQYDPLTLFFVEQGITGDLITRQSLSSVPDDVLVKFALWSAGESVILTLSAETEQLELSKDLIAAAMGVPVETVATASSDSILGVSLNRLVPFCLPPKVTKVFVNTELMAHEDISLPVGPNTYLNTNPGILKLIKEASFVPLSMPRVNLNFPKKSLFLQWANQIVQQPDKNIITVNNVLESQVASKWRMYDPTAQYLSKLCLLNAKFSTKDSERWIPDEVIARQVVWNADGKLVAVVHSDKQDPSAELVAKALGLEQDKVSPLPDAEYPAKVGCARTAPFTILYPTPTITKVLFSESLMQHKFVIVQISPAFSLHIPTNSFAAWTNAEIALICPPKLVQRKNVFNEWHSLYAPKTVADLLKAVHVADWGSYDPTTKLLQDLQLEATWGSILSLSLAPDAVNLKQYVFPLEEEVVVVLAAQTSEYMLNKELLATALGLSVDKVNQATQTWFDTVGVTASAFSIFNPVAKARILIDEKAIQQKVVYIATGHNPLILLKPNQLLKLEKASVAPLTCAPNEHAIKHIADVQAYERLSHKQKKKHDKQPKKSLLVNWVDQLKNGQSRTRIDSLLCYSDFFDYEPIVDHLLKLGVEGDFIKRGIDAQRISTRAAQMKIPANQVLKELIWVADGKPVLVLSNGDDPIDDNYLAAALGCAVDQLSRPKKLELEPLCGLPAHLISAFSPSLKVDKIVVNQRILDLAEVATSSGRPEVSLIIKPAIFTRLPNVVVANLVNPELIEQLRIEREQRKMEAQAREEALRQAANNNNNNTDTTTNNTTNATETQQPVQEAQPVTNTNQTVLVNI